MGLWLGFSVCVCLNASVYVAAGVPSESLLINLVEGKHDSLEPIHSACCFRHR